LIPKQRQRSPIKKIRSSQKAIIRNQGLVVFIPEIGLFVDKSRETNESRAGIAPTIGESTLATKRGGLIGGDTS
jgi:hypothetical protein